MTARTFDLRIELENDSMRSGEDLAQALRRIAARVERYSEDELPGARAIVQDSNGNTVGSWVVTE